VALRATVHAIVSDAFDPGQAQALALAALARACAIGLPESEARLLWVLLLANLSEGRAAEAIEAGEQSLALAYALVVHLVQYVPLVIMGLIFAWQLQMKPTALTEIETETVDQKAPAESH
jgi:hypothetical protein